LIKDEEAGSKVQAGHCHEPLASSGWQLHDGARRVTAVNQGSPGLKLDEEEHESKSDRLADTDGILTVAFSSSVPAALNSASASAAPAPAATANPANAAAVPEPHPQIREAWASLRRAKDHLEHAAHDFGGPRVEAIRATGEIHQLELCLKFDK
jgi:hypothetical protein